MAALDGGSQVPAGKPTRILFLSSSSFGIPPLQALLADSRYQVVGLIAQPDKPAGRGLRVVPAAIVQVARRALVPVLQPADLRSPSAMAEAQALAPDLVVVAAYGQWIPAGVYEYPPLGSLNIHPSLLPRHRGAAPAMSALLAGDRVAGVTILFVVEEMDAGDILAQAALAIEPDDTTATLMNRLALLGARLLSDTLPAYLAGRIEPRPQDHCRATWFGRVCKEMGRIDWSEPAELIRRKVQAYTPWPTAFTTYAGRRLRIVAAECREWQGPEAPGTVVRTPEGVNVVTGEGALLLRRVQWAGKRELETEAFARGQRGFIGARLGY